MPSVVGVICEFNPFHNGHVILLSEIKKQFGDDCVIVALMSGNFVQRGEPSCMPKHNKAKIAVENGFDLIFEFPFPFCCSGADTFAKSGVYLLNSIGVEYIVFGSETGKLDYFYRVANNMLSKEFIDNCYSQRKNKDNSNKSYVSLQQETFTCMFDEKFPDNSNDILATEYVKAIISNGFKIKPFTYLRNSSHSAKLCRTNWKLKKFDDLSSMVPFNSFNSMIEFEKPADYSEIESFILGALRTKEQHNNDELTNIIKKNSFKSSNYDNLMMLTVNKTITRAKFKRCMLYELLDVNTDFCSFLPGFLTLLAMNNKGANFLSNLGVNNIKIISKCADYRKYDDIVIKQFEINLKSDYIYSLCLPYRFKNYNPFLISPFVI